MIKGTIFDVDGTLLDSMGMWFDVCKEFCLSYGIEMTDAKANSIKDLRLEESLPDIIQENHLPITVDKAVWEIQQLAAKTYKNSVCAKPHALEYLKKLKSLGIKTAVATSGYKELCTSAFKRLGIYDFIDVYAYSSEVGKGKENPDIYLLAADRLNLKPSECIVFEDISIGLKSAKKSGFLTCAVYDSSNASETEHLKAVSDFYIYDWKDIISSDYFLYNTFI